MEYWFETLVWNTGLKKHYTIIHAASFAPQSLFCLKILEHPENRVTKFLANSKYTNIVVKSSFIFYFKQLFLVQIEKKHVRCNSAVYTSQSNISLVVFTLKYEHSYIVQITFFSFNDLLLQNQKKFEKRDYFPSLEIVQCLPS